VDEECKNVRTDEEYKNDNNAFKIQKKFSFLPFPEDASRFTSVIVVPTSIFIFLTLKSS